MEGQLKATNLFPIRNKVESACSIILSASKKRSCLDLVKSSASAKVASAFSANLARRNVAKSRGQAAPLLTNDICVEPPTKKTLKFVVPFLKEDDDDDDTAGLNAKPSEGVVEVEAFSKIGLRVRNLPAEHVAMCMKNRKFVSLSEFRHSLKSFPNISVFRRNLFRHGDWVTIAVLGLCLNVGPSKWAQTSYRLWQLGDLDGNSIGVVLRSDSVKVHGHLSLGHVVAILNPGVVPSVDEDSMVLVVKSPAQIALLGTAWCSSFCTSQNRKGKRCPNLVNQSKTDSCDYHLLKALGKERIRRMALNDVGGGSLSREIQEASLKNACYHATLGMFVFDHVMWKISADEFLAVGPDRPGAEQVIENAERLSKRPMIGVRNFKYTALGASFVGSVEDRLKRNKKQIMQQLSVRSQERATLHPNVGLLHMHEEGVVGDLGLDRVNDGVGMLECQEESMNSAEFDVELEFSG